MHELHSVCYTHRLTSEQSAKYKVFLSTSLVASCTLLHLKHSHFHSLHPTQSVAEQAIDYLSSFLKVERLTQNLILQRWVSVTLYSRWISALESPYHFYDIVLPIDSHG